MAHPRWPDGAQSGLAPHLATYIPTPEGGARWRKWSGRRDSNLKGSALPRNLRLMMPVLYRLSYTREKKGSDDERTLVLPRFAPLKTWFGTPSQI